MQLKIMLSTINDGSMKSPDKIFATALPVRTEFLANSKVKPDDTTLVQVTYEGQDYCRYVTLDDTFRGDGIVRPPTIESDALVTTSAGHALFLPLADCIGAIIHDPSSGILMVSHLGRHNLEQFGGKKCIEYLFTQHHVNPENLTVWLSPAAGREAYPLYAFENRSLHDVATEQLYQAGVPYENITSSPIDSATDERFYSHSQFLKGNRGSDGRFAIAAIVH